MLTKLELQNFKSHRHTKFNFDESRLQAVVGKNSSGKTSLLQALTYLGQLSTVKGQYWAAYREDISTMVTSIGENSATIGSDIVIIAGGDNNWDFHCRLYIDKNKKWDKIRTWRTDEEWLDDKNEIEEFCEILANKGQEIDPFDEYQQQEINDIFDVKSDLASRFYWKNELEFVSSLKLAVNNLTSPAYSEELIPEVKLDGSGLAPALDYLRSEDPDRFQAIEKMLQQVVPSVRRIGTKRVKIKLEFKRSIIVDDKRIPYEEDREVIGQEIFLDMATGEDRKSVV